MGRFKGAVIGCELPPALVAALNAKNKTLLSPAHQPQPETCFYDLPAELRNYIYELAMENNLNTKFTVAPILPVHDKFQEPSILQASKQIRAEAGAMFYGSNVFKFLIKGKIKKLRQLRKNAPHYRAKSYLARASRWIRMICHFNGLKAFRTLVMIFERDLNRSGLIEELVGLKYATGIQVGILSGLSEEEAAQTEQKGGVLVKCNYWSANKKKFAKAMLEVAAKAREEGWTPGKLQEEFAVQFDLTFPDY